MPQSTIMHSIQNNTLTASEKIDLWNKTYNDIQVRNELLKVKEDYPEYANEAYYPKNPYFPNILDQPFFNNEQATREFIHLFFPKEIALTYDQYISKQTG